MLDHRRSAPRLAPPPTLRVAAAALAIGFGGPGAADDVPEEPAGGGTYEEKIVVTAARGKATAGDTPGAVSFVGAEELALTRTAASFPDLLGTVPGVMVQKTARGFGSPYIRGFTGYRALTLVDGIRLNNSTFRDGPNQYGGTIDLFDVERVEVQRGPGSVLHGSDAVGGTLMVVPRLARPGAADRGTLRATYRGATEEASNAGHLSYESAAERWAAMAGVTYRNLGDLRAGSGTGVMKDSGFDEVGWNANATADVGATTRVTLAAQRYQERGVPRWHRTVASPGWHGTAPGTDLSNVYDQQRFLGYARVSGDPGLPGLDTARLTLSFQRQTEGNDRVAASAARTVQGFGVNTYGADLQLDATLARHRVTYGLEGYLDRVGSYRSNYSAAGTLTSTDVQGPIGDDARYWTLGAYVRDRWRVLERLALVGGIRLDVAAVEADRVKDPLGGGAAALRNDWRAVVGDLRAIVELAPGLHAYAGASQGFRTPSLGDLTSLDLAEQGQVELPAPDLRPERYLSYEAGFKGSSAILSGQVAVFRTEIRDMIDRYLSGETVALPGGQTATVVRKANVAQGFVHGIEAEGSVRLHRALLLGGQFFWTRGYADTTVVENGASRLARYPLSRVAPATGALWLRLGLEAYWVEAELLAAAKQGELSLKDTKDTTRIPPGGTPGYAVLNLRAGVRLQPGTDVVAVVRNVGNADYRIHGSGINEPGFGLELAARFTLRH